MKQLATFGLAIAALIALGLSGQAMAIEPWQLNMTEGVTSTAREAYRLHMIIMWICVIIGVLVFGAMFVAMFKFRKSKGAVAATWSHDTTAEVLWTVIPILILIGMAWPATKSLIFMADTKNAEMTIKVTGYQWRWRYEYVGTDVNFISSLDHESNKARQLGSGIDPTTVENYLLNVDREVVVPVDTKIRFLLTADDVIHAWWVPALGWKQDAIPGIVNEAWATIETPGVYRGQCAELCGKDHGFMPIVVRAVSKAEYQQWLAAQSGDKKTNAVAATN